MSISTLGIPNVSGTVAAIPINPMGCDGITWDVPQRVPCPMPLSQVSVLSQWAMGCNGTQNSVGRATLLSHPVPWYTRTGWIRGIKA